MALLTNTIEDATNWEVWRKATVDIVPGLEGKPVLGGCLGSTCRLVSIG